MSDGMASWADTCMCNMLGVFSRTTPLLQDCSNPVTRNISCARIHCRFPNFGSTTTVQIRIIGYLDERFYSVSCVCIYALCACARMCVVMAKMHPAQWVTLNSL